MAKIGWHSRKACLGALLSALAVAIGFGAAACGGDPSERAAAGEPATDSRTVQLVPEQFSPTPTPIASRTPVPEAAVTGTVDGSSWEFGQAVISGRDQFILSAAEDSPSDAKVFFFLNLSEEESLEGLSFQATLQDVNPGTNLHVHFTDVQGERTVEMVSMRFALELETGEGDDGLMPARLRLEIPSIDLEIEGEFELVQRTPRPH